LGFVPGGGEYGGRKADGQTTAAVVITCNENLMFPLDVESVLNLSSDVIDLLQPNKTDTVRYLNGISPDLPPRWARVEINQGNISDELVYEYMV
jgi:hypothetical protein